MNGRIPDKTILQKVNQRLSRTGTNATGINATIRSGEVTITGKLSYEHQRQAIVSAAQSVEGVRRIVDLLQVQPRAKIWK